MKCPRRDCDRLLVVDEFYPPGAYQCPEHGGPIWHNSELTLEVIQDFDRISITELDAVTSMLSRLSSQGKLLFSIDKDMSGRSPTIVTVENHGPEEIDVRLLFDCYTGKLIEFKCHTDRRR